MKPKDDEDGQDEGVRLLMPEAIILNIFAIWLLSDFKVLPDEGGWLDQDIHIQHDFLELFTAYRKVQDAPPPAEIDVDNLPSFRNL